MTVHVGRSIRAMAHADIAELQRIDTIAHGSAWTYRTFCDEVARNDRIHLVAEAYRTILGHSALWVDGTVGRVTNVAVRDDAAGEGHGSALVLAVVNQAVAMASVRSLELEVRASNRRAQRLYNRFGFAPVGIERDFYDAADERGSRDALVMTVSDVDAGPWRDRLVLIAAEQRAGAAA